MCFGILLGFAVLEVGMRTAGWLLNRAQARSNQLSLDQGAAVRVLCVGESTTALGGEQSYPRQLESILNAASSKVRFSVVNAGITATNTDTILERLEGWLDSYHPQVVVVMMGINDQMGYLEDAPSRAAWVLDPLRKMRTYKLFSLLAHNLAARFGLGEWLAEESPRPELIDLRPPMLRLKDAAPVVQEANEALRTGRFAVARDLLEDRFAHDPADFETAYLLTLSLIVMSADGSEDVYDRAQAALESRVAASPADARAKDGLVRLYLVRRELVKADDMVLADDPASPSISGETRLLLADLHSQEASRLMEQRRFLDAADPLRRALAVVPERAVDQRSRIHAQLAVLERQLGKPDAASENLHAARELQRDVYPERTRRNYVTLERTLQRRGIQLIVMQYPTRPLAPLRDFLDDPRDVIFVDNEAVFRDAIDRSSYEAIFTDHFAGDFGHLTPRGNELLAKGAARAVIDALGAQLQRLRSGPLPHVRSGSNATCFATFIWCPSFVEWCCRPALFADASHQSSRVSIK